MAADFFTQSAADDNAQLAASSPVPSAQPPGPGEVFSSAWNESKYYSGLGAAFNAQANFLQSRLDAFRDQTGETIPNPMMAGFGSPQAGEKMAAAFAYAKGQFDKAAQPTDSRVPDRNLPAFPTEQEIADGGAALSRKSVADAADIGDRSAGPTALAAKLAAQATRATLDPLNAIAIAAIPEGGIALKALGAAGAFGAQAGAEDILTGAYKNAVTPGGFGAQQAMGDVESGALGGAGFELGGAALGKIVGLGWRRLVGTRPDIAASLPQPVQDAGNVAAKAEDLHAQNPFKTGASGEAAHVEAIATVEQQILDGKEPELPDSAVAEAAKRTGDVFVPPAETGLQQTTGDQYILRDPLSAKADGETMNVRVIRNKETGEIDALYTDELGVTKVAPAHRGLSPEQAIAETLGDHPQGEAADASKVSPAPASAPKPAPTSRAFFGGGRAINVKYELAEASDLVTSHDDGFHVNPDYPAELQPRNRGGKPATEQVYDILNRLEPEMLGRSAEANSGAPIVGPDNVVESGNGRAMALRMMYARGRVVLPEGAAAFRHEGRIWTGGRHIEAVNRAIDELGPASIDKISDGITDASFGHIRGGRFVQDGESGLRTVTKEIGSHTAIKSFYENDTDRSGPTPTTEGDAGYRAFLEREGFDTSGFKAPVLVRRRVTPMSDSERESFAQAANGSVALRMTAAEQALADARHLSPDIVELAKRGEVTSAGNRDFVRAFLAKLPQGERGDLQAQDGGLSSTGVDRVRAAMFARAYGDPAVVARLYEHPDPNIKTIGHALSAAAPDWMQMRDAVTRGELPAGQDVTPNVMEAVKAVMRARDTGRPVSEVLAQGDMFSSDMTGMVSKLFMKADDTSKFLSKDAMARNVTDFAAGLRKDIEQGVNLMGEGPRSAEQVLKDTISASQRRVNALVEAAKSSEAIEKALSGEARDTMDESLFAGLNRDIEQGSNKFVTEDGKEAVADPVLAKIESDEALAKEIGACSLPAPAEAAE